MAVIETQGLTKHYGSGRFPPRRRHETVRALHDLTVSIEEGEIFGFLGPNGAGKTTTIRLLLGLLHPTSGSARVLGHDIVARQPRDSRRDRLPARRHRALRHADRRADARLPGPPLRPSDAAAR